MTAFAHHRSILSSLAATALRMTAVMTLVLGLLYPLVVTAIATVVAPDAARGSLQYRGDTVVASALIGQPWPGPAWFMGRPSATGYRALPSGATNLGPTSAVLRDSVRARRRRLAVQFGVAPERLPADLLTASASGLDPHCSPEAVRLQVDRVAAARRFDVRQRAWLVQRIERAIEPPFPCGFGPSRINVVLLNLALDSVPQR